MGVNATPIDVELLKIDIRMERKKSEALGFTMTVNDAPMKDLNSLYKRVRELYRLDDELKVTIYPGKEIEYGHVVKVVNECLRANFTEITFAGAPKEAGGA